MAQSPSERTGYRAFPPGPARDLLLARYLELQREYDEQAKTNARLEVEAREIRYDMEKIRKVAHDCRELLLNSGFTSKELHELLYGKPALGEKENQV